MSERETRISQNDAHLLGGCVTKLTQHLQVEQECPADMNFSVLNRAEIILQFLEHLLGQIAVKGKTGGGCKNHGEGARINKVKQ